MDESAEQALFQPARDGATDALQLLDHRRVLGRPYHVQRWLEALLLMCGHAQQSAADPQPQGHREGIVHPRLDCLLELEDLQVEAADPTALSSRNWWSRSSPA